jgi:hypothetical protein
MKLDQDGDLKMLLDWILSLASHWKLSDKLMKNVYSRRIIVNLNKIGIFVF